MSRIYLSKAEVTEVEERYVLDALRSGWIAPLGPHVDAFEREIAERVGVAGALALSSGTAALHLALLDAGAGPGTLIPVSTMTFAATVNAIAYTGAEPVFIDSQLSDGNVDAALMIEAVDTLLVEGARIPAVVTVDLFGRCADYSTLLPALRERGILLVEDAAEALGAQHAGKAAGSFGRSAALSFNGNKILTTSGGGMLLSDDPEVIERARYLSTQARQPVPWYEHTEVGYNYRMSNILAALGRGQLERLDAMILRRREIRAMYESALGDIPGIRFLRGPHGMPGTEGNSWLTTIIVEGRGIQASADIVSELARQEIEVRSVWKPMHTQPVFRTARGFVNGNAEALFARGLTLPSGAGLTNDEIERVAQGLRQALECA